MIPHSTDEAAALLGDELRRLHRAGAQAAELLKAGLRLVTSWPEAVRPSSVEVEMCVGFIAGPSAVVIPEPVAAPAFASERLLAERLAAGPLRQSMRFVTSGPDAGWRAWSGDCWAECWDAIPRPFAAEIHREVGNLLGCGLLDQRTTARQMETTSSMRGVLAQVSAYPEVQLAPDDIDPPDMLPTVGGVLDLVSDVILVNDPATSRFLRCAAVGYDPQATHPLWNDVIAHMGAITGAEVVQRFMGASMIGKPPDRKALFLVGSGGDGKSTLLRSCALALGGFATVVPAEGLAGEGRGAHGHELLSGLAAARLAIATEVRSQLDWSLFKSLTGGDPRATKRLHGRLLQVQPRAWLALATNDEPRPPDSASRDRCIVMRWTKPADPNPEIVALLSTPGEERNVYLRAVLRWMVEGCHAFRREGLGVPDFARAETEPVGLAGWFDSRIEAKEFRLGGGCMPFEELAADARAWSQANGQEVPTDTAVGTFLSGRLPVHRRTCVGRKVRFYTVERTRLDRVKTVSPHMYKEDGLDLVQLGPSLENDPVVITGLDEESLPRT